MKNLLWLPVLAILIGAVLYWLDAVNEEDKANRSRIAMEEPDRRSNEPKVDPYKAMQTASRLETVGKSAEAVQMYIRAASAGRCDAALRLGEIYGKGLLGVSPSPTESDKWYNAARVLGCTVPSTSKGLSVIYR